jgi:hypothetical protein
MWPFPIMQLFNLMAHVMCTMHRIMAVMEGGGGYGKQPPVKRQTDRWMPAAQRRDRLRPR